MRLLHTLVAAPVILSTSVLARNIPRAELEPRADINAVEAILLAIGSASAFCSSFDSIKDVTSTVSGTPQGTPVVVTAACTSGAGSKREAAAPATTQSATSGASTTGSSSKTTSATATAAKCPIKGVNPNIAVFACDVISQACSALVKPKTIKVTNTKPGTTTVTPKCSTTTSAGPSFPTVCTDAQTTACGSDCYCFIRKTDGAAECTQGGYCDATCTDDAYCQNKYGAQNPGYTYTCVYTGTKACTDPTFNNQGCFLQGGGCEQLPTSAKRSLEKVFRDAKKRQMGIH